MHVHKNAAADVLLCVRAIVARRRRRCSYVCCLCVGVCVDLFLFRPCACWLFYTLHTHTQMHAHIYNISCVYVCMNGVSVVIVSTTATSLLLLSVCVGLCVLCTRRRRRRRRFARHSSRVFWAEWTHRRARARRSSRWGRSFVCVCVYTFSLCLAVVVVFIACLLLSLQSGGALLFALALHHARVPRFALPVGSPEIARRRLRCRRLLSVRDPSCDRRTFAASDRTSHRPHRTQTITPRPRIHLLTRRCAPCEIGHRTTDHDHPTHRHQHNTFV